MAHNSFHFHYARPIELRRGLEKIEAPLHDPSFLDTRFRAAENSLEGVGMIEAPVVVPIHHYKVDEQGAIRWANLAVATAHNSRAINLSAVQVARHFIDGQHMKEGMLNRVSAAAPACDPCLSDPRRRNLGYGRSPCSGRAAPFSTGCRRNDANDAK